MSSRQQRGSTQVPPPFEVTKNENFRYVYATGVYGGINPNDSRLIFYLDRPVPESVQGQPFQMRTMKMEQELQVEVHMSPYQFKGVSLFMSDRVKMYEEKFGEIELRPEAEKKTEDKTPGHIA
jgi:hypothetical protein